MSDKIVPIIIFSMIFGFLAFIIYADVNTSREGVREVASVIHNTKLVHVINANYSVSFKDDTVWINRHGNTTNDSITSYEKMVNINGNWTQQLNK